MSGRKPAQSRNGNEDTATVTVRASRSDTSNGGSIRVVIVEEATADYEDLNVSIQQNTGSFLKTGGSSFAVELSEGFLVDTIEIDAVYDCDADESTIDLYLFDTDVRDWRRAGDYCTAAQAKAPVFDNGMDCTATFTVCHLTQFVVTQGVIETEEPTTEEPTTQAPAAAVDETADGSSSAADDGLADGWLAVIVTGACLVAIALVVVVVVLKKNKHNESNTNDIESGESWNPTQADAASASSSSATSSASSSSALSSGASQTDSSSASASSSSSASESSSS